MKTSSVIQLACLSIALFLAGRFWGQRRTQASLATDAVAETASASETSAARATPINQDLNRLLLLMLRLSAPQPAAPNHSFTDTAERRAQRHSFYQREWARRFPDLDRDQIQAGLAINDESSAKTIRLQNELISGALSENEYEESVRQQYRDRQREARAVLSDDQYRRVVGVEPDSDFFEVAKGRVSDVPTAINDTTYTSKDQYAGSFK
jgi:hypothetical protein